ncbi:aldose epimerase family protein, partial [Nocardioides sp.]|uniref:aldose epimerase family protein n=1 Tax=Nocardioides sp. TaxID=35761 RepID=UPI002737682B
LPPHDRGNNLHGGPDGFDRRVWDVLDHGTDHLLLELVSPDGDQGFPGTVTARVRFEVDGDTLRTTCTARTDAPTLVSMTSHTYLNLEGEAAGSIDDHLLTVHADHYTPTDATSIPLGDHADVGGTPFDLRTPARVGAVVRHDHEQLLLARGVDHNYVVRGSGMRELARLTGGGLELSLRSDQPGLQVYTGNFLDGTQRGTSGGLYRQGAGIALEPQHFPDSPHHPEWPSTVLRPGEDYRTVTELAVTSGAARTP